MLCAVRKFIISRLLEGGIVRGIISVNDLHRPLLDLF